MKSFQCLTTLCALHLAIAREEYLARIPNPSGVSGFAALGHTDGVNGGGPRNDFGIDFAANSYAWAGAFCELDSDNDGLTNGQELGDPCCEWTPDNGNALITEGLSHPGLSNSTSSNSALTSPTCSHASTVVMPTIFLWTCLLLAYTT